VSTGLVEIPVFPLGFVVVYNVFMTATTNKKSIEVMKSRLH